jgi:chemotaxis protein methyltransferase CheR
MNSPAVKNMVSEPELVEIVAAEVEELTGIKLGESQHKMVQARLQKRMRSLDIPNPKEYLAYLRANEAKEMPKLVSLLTTHHTFFFREFPQFEYLAQTALPAVIAQMKKEKRTHIRIWSAGCSRGEEVYSLSIFLSHHLKKLAPGFTYEILGGDICTESIAIARNGVYHWDAIKEIPAMYLEGNWIRGKGSVADYAKIKPEIKSPCSFEIINIKNIGDSIGDKVFDFIFCRNVFIYFIAQRIQTIVGEMLKHLNPSGFLFLGMTENLMGLDLPVTNMGLSVYRPAGAPAVTPQPAIARAAVPDTLRVLCVDDSPTVLKLLKHILSPSSGFEVVGTAGNGIEAAKFLKSNTVDLVTLDIHMPGQNGIDYLKQNFNDAHPPVVLVSTVAREDADLAHRALELGAIDYIEKPALDGLAQRSDEIRAKLLCAYQAKKNHVPVHDNLGAAFGKSLRLQSIDLKLRVIVAGAGNLPELQYILNEFHAPQPPIAVLLTGPDNILDSVRQKIAKGHTSTVQLERSIHESLENNTIYVGSFDKDFNWLKERNPDLQVSLMALDILNEEGLSRLRSWPNVHLIVQDLADLKVDQYKKMRQVANEVVPYTSFAYASDVFFNRKYVQEGMRSVITLQALEPATFENSEIVKIISHRDALVCLFHTRKNIGGALKIPDAILTQDSLLMEQRVKKLISMMGTHADNLKAKVVGSPGILKKVTEILTEQKVYISFAREITISNLEAYFFTDTGRLRLPKNLTGTANAAPPAAASPEPVPRPGKKTRVLVVDDSKVVRETLRRMIEEDGSMEVVGTAERPEQVAGLIEKLRPDVMTLDIVMPGMSGVDLLKEIIPRFAIPTIMISAVSLEEGQQVIQALEIGAIDYIQKPEFSQIPLLAPLIREKIRIASSTVPKSAQEFRPPQKTVHSAGLDQKTIVAIGASTGGTAAIRTLLSGLPENIPPVVIAQHIPAVFSTAFAARLNKLMPFNVKEAVNGELLQPGTVLVAPGGMQMEIAAQGTEFKVIVRESEQTQLHKPSVDILFKSVAQAAGKNAIGILLTGMGKDGAEGMLNMRQKGARTFAQDRENCTVFGMPKAAIECGAAEYIQPLDQIAKTVISLLTERGKSARGPYV